jgi:hypothetical protein
MYRFTRAPVSRWAFGSLVGLVTACNATSPDPLTGPPVETGGSSAAGASGAIGAGGRGSGGAPAGGSLGVAGGIPPIGSGGMGPGGSMGVAGSSLGGAAGSPFGQGGFGRGGGIGRGGSMSTAGSGNAGGASNGGTGTGGASNGGTSNGGAAGSAGAGGCVQDLKCMPAAPSTGDIYADCVARVNQFRACACLPPLQRWMDGEACANQDASYDAMNQSMGAHAGFKAKICAAGNAQDECPGWRSNDQVISGCLQQMFNEGPPPTNPCTGTCYEQHGHFINMTNTRYTMVACGYYTASNGQIWAVQNFK